MSTKRWTERRPFANVTLTWATCVSSSVSLRSRVGNPGLPRMQGSRFEKSESDHFTEIGRLFVGREDDPDRCKIDSALSL